MTENARLASENSNFHVKKEYNVIRLLYNGTPSNDEQEVKLKEEKKEYNVTRFLYYETPSDDEEKNDKALPLTSLDGKKESKKRKNKDIEEQEPTTEHKVVNATPSAQSETVLPSSKRVKTKVWSNEDEIALLKGMIKFKKETSSDAAKNMMKFHPLMLKSLVLKATNVQLREKIRRLKQKYEKSVESGNGSKTEHEGELFHLCEKIWPINPKQEPISSETGPPEQPNSFVTGQPEQPNSSRTGQPELPNSSGSGQREQQNVLLNGQREKQNIPEIGLPGQWPRQHIVMPETGLNEQALETLFERLSKDVEVVVNSHACLRGNKKEVNMRVFGLYSDNLKLRTKFEELVLEKANSPELRGSPELLEQELLRAYLQVRVELTQQLLNAYKSFTKAPPKKVVASSSNSGVATEKKEESGDDSSSEEEDPSDEA